MRYFKNIQVGTIEAVSNKDVIAQMEDYPEVYEEVFPKGAEPEKKAKAPKKEAKK
ncbi:hypothetical protein IKD67_01740 [Candidatus Saccharibacteria bacterium]|nr:hypothetical protein [Candidatus Saccharibacteria bacterium]